MDKNKDQLLEKYLSGHCSEEERAAIEQEYNHFAKSKENLIKPDQNRLAQTKLAMWSQIDTRTSLKKHNYTGRWLIGAAASLIIVFGLYYSYRNTEVPLPAGKSAKHLTSIPPGGNNATLTLASGHQIILNNLKDGAIQQENGVRIQKNKDGELTYVFAADQNQNVNSYNTITTPRGGKYTVKLADGTLAMLDAQSSIHFPVVFQGKTRAVTTTGQVYFEVAHDPTKPFIVTSGKQSIEVLGTHFNIENYNEKGDATTTLIEGKVKVHFNGRTAVLKPGQQSTVNATKPEIIVGTVDDIEEVLAWKNGFFKFNDADVVSIMQELSRWYDIKVQYQGSVTTKRFSGKIYRTLNFDEVLNILKFSKIKLKRDGNTITVTN